MTDDVVVHRDADISLDDARSLIGKRIARVEADQCTITLELDDGTSIRIVGSDYYGEYMRIEVIKP